MINKKRLMNTFLDYIQIDSETKNEKAISERLAHDLKDLGFEVYIDNAGQQIGSNGNNVYCFVPGNSDGDSILFSAHMDTVKPGIGIEPYIDNGYVKSKGDTILGGDDKAGVAAIMEALRTLKENDLPHGPIEIVFSIYEEGGLYGAKNVEYGKLKSKNAIVLDSGGTAGTIIIQAPGQINIKAKVIGKASHAGSSPEDGISAIMVAAEAVTNMTLLRVDHETTANIGTFKAEGATNIVASVVEFVAEARSLSNDKLDAQGKHMVDCLLNAANKYGAKVEYNIETNYSSFKLDENNPLIEKIADKCQKLGLEVTKIPTGGGSDANIFNKNGINAVVIGVGMELVHTVNEQLNINDFENASEAVLELMKK